MISHPSCPGCGEPLHLEKRRLGLVARYPSRCDECGVSLLYDTAGGVYVREDHRAAEDSEAPRAGGDDEHGPDGS